MRYVEGLIRCTKIIRSCTNKDQLNTATKYYILMAWHIFPDPWDWEQIESRTYFRHMLKQELKYQREKIVK